ncbi:MAG: DUF1629 domain-containing protein [Ginsengibacter sp.]
MKYYKINFTLNPKLRGANDYIKDYRFRKDSFEGFYWEEPKFIGNISGKKIDFIPYTVDIQLSLKANILDLIERGGPLSSQLLVSGKLKSILERYRTFGIQYFQFNVIKNKIIYDDYWILHMYEFNQMYIDFKKSKIIYKRKMQDYETTHQSEKIALNVNSLEDFNDYLKMARENVEVITINRLSLFNDKIKEDFFSLEFVEGGIGYFVSEKLKTEIEEAECTGIEFQPSHLSYNE